MKLAYLLAPALLVSSAAYAADAVYGEAAPEPPVAAQFDWTGAYFGINAGGAFGTFKHPAEVYDITTDPATLLGSGALDISAGGFVGGVQAGWNWQSDNVIYGIETDLQGSTLKAEDKITIDDVGEGSLGTKVDWYGSLRGRLGFAASDRFMVYGTGGLAYGRVKSYIDAEPLGLVGDYSETKTGWTVGGGGEFAVTEHVTFRGEYLYTDLGKTTVFEDELGLGIGAKLDNDVAFHTFRIGLNYKF
jgi:outer membrane immunogenic protein